MKGKKLTGILIAAVIVLLVCVVGTTFAYYFATLRGKNENTISTSKVTLILTEQNEPFDTVQIATEQDVLLPMMRGYDFSISAKSTGRAAIAYAIYLEETEGNTIKAKDISVSLVKVDSEGNEIRIPEYDYGTRCINDREYDIVGEGLCSYYPEIYDDLHRWEEVSVDSNPYGANFIMHEYLFKMEGYNKICNDKKIYYHEEIINIEGEEQAISTVVGEENETVDNSYCTYTEDYYPISKSLPLDGEDAFKNAYWYDSRMNETEIQQLKQKNLIYFEYLHNESGKALNETINYRLRYFIDANRISDEAAQGTVNSDGSVSVDLGQDGVFKFKIGVYAKSIAPC